jgi:ankyrin repeat protein
MGSAEAKLKEKFLFAIVTNHEGDVNKILQDHPQLAEVALVNNMTNPICRAAYLGHQKIVAILIKYGASINNTSSDGKTPLHWAVMRNNFTLAQFLVEN